MRYAATLLFDDVTVQAAIDLSIEIGDYCKPSPPTLDREGNAPHLSLTQVELEEGDIGAARTALETVVAAFRAKFPDGLKLDLKHIGPARRGSHWMFWTASRSQSLLRLHEETVRVLNPVRKDRKVEVSIAKMDPLQQQMYERWGYPHVMQAYQPHITLGVLSHRHANDRVLTAQLTKVRAHTPASVRLAFLEMGEHGIVIAELFSLPL